MIGLKGELNTYAYVEGTPPRFIDPLGLDDDAPPKVPPPPPPVPSQGLTQGIYIQNNSDGSTNEVYATYDETGNIIGFDIYGPDGANLGDFRVYPQSFPDFSKQYNLISFVHLD